MVPATVRSPVVLLIALAALGWSLHLMRNAGAIGWSLRVFVLAVVASWALNPRDLAGLRHFAGIALGILLMAGVATWATTSIRLARSAILIAILGLAILLVGLATTSITRAKMLIGARPIETGSLFPWLPERQLPLPGLEGTAGRVNPNALAGVALMLLPVCTGIAVASRLAPHHGWLLLTVGLVTTTAATAILGLTRSRTALLATGLTIVILALFWRRGRWWLVGLIVAVGLAAGATAMRSRSVSPEMYAQGVEFMRTTARVRFLLWQEGMRQLRERPLLGIGISQFRTLTPEPGLQLVTDRTLTVAHAHNIFLQVALDVGLIGLSGYLVLFGTVVLVAKRAACERSMAATIAAGAGLSLVAVHLFGINDAIALGAKVGGFQWLCAGLVLANCRAIVPQRAPE